MVREQVALSGYTTLRLGGPVTRFVDADTDDEIVAAVRDADLAGEPVLVLGGGSNLVVADTGFVGTVIRVASSGITMVDRDDGVRATVAAGENWGQLVDWAVAEKLVGLECLAGIPGLTGATPIQNVGAYGQEVATVIETVRVYDRASASIGTLTGADCGFGYRTSLFKISPMPARQAAEPTGRYVVLSVTFRLRRDPMSAPLRYLELAARLGVAAGESAPLADVRAAVLELRRTKGMVLDPTDPDTASAGSFFTNPVLDRGQFTRLERSVTLRRGVVGVPSFPADQGRIKVPAGWLIEQAGFPKGYPGSGAARISSKHTLALTNRGGASTADLIDLAREIVAGVWATFGIELTNEPVLVGVSL
jgi:UDP-N-acetylmuramate dehydrogenase